MADKPSLLVDLFKYPVLVFSIFLALVFSKHFLGIDFRLVTEMGPSGIRFAKQTQGTIGALTELESKIKQVVFEIELLKKPRDQEATAAIVSPAEKSKLFSVAQTVSDQTADLTKILTEGDAKALLGLRGYIWIGNYKDQWKLPKLASLDSGQLITIPPSQIELGTEYKVLGNMVLRDGLPQNDLKYFRAKRNLGVIPRGTRVRIVTIPTGIDRKFAIQYWVEVEVP